MKPTHQPIPRGAVVLSSIAAAGAAIASVATIMWSGAFPDPTPAPTFNTVLAEARGWSAVTLALALPTLMWGLAAARRGSLKGRLAWLGGLCYLVYTFLEMAVSGPFTALYLVYIATFGCAIPALVMGLVGIDVAKLPEGFLARAPRRATAWFGAVYGVLLAMAWLRGIVTRTVTGDFGWPDAYGSIAHTVHALDLGLLVPFGVAAAWLLWRRRPWGFVVGALMLVNASLMAGALFAMVAVSAVLTSASLLDTAPFALLWVVSSGLGFAYFRALSGDRRPGLTGTGVAASPGTKARVASLLHRAR